MFGKDENPSQELERKFWKAIESDRTMMLGLKGVDDDRTRPMTAQVYRPDGIEKGEGGTIYFFASRNEGVGADLAKGNRAVATFVDKGHDLYAHIHGTLVDATTPEMVAKLWSPFVAPWYEKGQSDPNLILIRFDAERADLWEADTLDTLSAVALKYFFDKDPGKEQQKEHQAEVTL